MTIRERIAEGSLRLELLLLGILIGASVYQRISLIPYWAGHLPDSVIRYFRGTNAGEAIGRFWTNVIPPTAIVMLIVLIAGWSSVSRRRWLCLGALLFFAMLVWTEVYFVPQGVIPLMARGGADLSPDEITRRASAWIFWDWFRMVGSIVSYFALMHAATVPARGTEAP